MTTANAASPTMTTTVHRIEIHRRAEFGDPAADALRREIEGLPASLTPRSVDCAAVYLIEGAFTGQALTMIAHELLADPVTQSPVIGAAAVGADDVVIEVHPLPGVMDPAAASIATAIHAMLGGGDTPALTVRTGRRYTFGGIDAEAGCELATRLLANPVVHAIHTGPYHPESFPVGHQQPFEVRDVPLCELDDPGLERLSRDAHLFLSLDEMRAIQSHYRGLGREPREIELETLAQTWSEHCVHKTLKATIEYREPAGDSGFSIRDTAADRPGHSVGDDGRVRIQNLLKSTVAAATHQLMADGLDDWCLSVFVDNAGIVGFDEDTAVCMKVETHNHPSAIEPYGGAATGIGGCIRDIMGTGLAAKPIAATDVFCVGTDAPAEIPTGCLHPHRILGEVVGGVRDYGNRMGIPTIDGGVWFDDRYIGNPLVYVGCVGVMPRDLIEGDARPGDRIIAMGGRTGRDGIHGATFSSAELTDTHADEFSHAVQIGNAITEKVTLDAVLAARDHPDGCLFSSITDCGAGGFSSAVGEMGEKIGAAVRLDRAPLKYEGLSPVEVWISEAQERMVLAVPAENVEAIAAICDRHDVEWCDLGEFGTPDRELVLHWGDVEVGRIAMEFMHDGVPMPLREAVWDPEWAAREAGGDDVGVESMRAIGDVAGVFDMTATLLGHPNLASKAWIVRQYDHEVQGGSVVKPFVGPNAGPGDAAVIRPVPDRPRGLAIGHGLATGLARDPYVMGLAAIDECVRNMVCVGADPDRIAILDNFCWPGCDDPRNLGSLVRAAEACLDGGLAYRTPFVSGKDSLNNQFTTEDGRTIRIPPTLLISGMGIVPEERLATTMDAKRPGSRLLAIGTTTNHLGGSHYLRVGGDPAAGVDELPVVDLERGPRIARIVHDAIRQGLVRSAHDASEGGILPAAIEMAFAGGLGLEFDLDAVPVEGGAVSSVARAFAEDHSRYLLEVAESDLPALERLFAGIPHGVVGTFVETGSDGGGISVSAADLGSASDAASRFEDAWKRGCDR
ncbi:MAG: phosphoribosylformylglycinamidine synthase [Phycisphaeraceae bacterium]|nr:phosphoribosylformylglycinamidine synthase [Phycisphaeraceae bacterium]